MFMGRSKKLDSEKKVKFSISLETNIYQKLNSEDIKRSRLIEMILKQYYENKNL